jgi:streptomycin 6-kinase
VRENMISNFKKNIINIFGNNAEHWLMKLPDLISELENKYQLTDLVPLANVSLNYVASGYQNENQLF